MGTAAVGPRRRATAGARAEGSLSPRLVYFAGHDITSERKKNLEPRNTWWNIRPDGTSAKNWGPFNGTTAIDLEWIALGCTAESFWTARRRWIVALESRVRFRVKGMNSTRLD